MITINNDFAQWIKEIEIRSLIDNLQEISYNKLTSLDILMRR